MKKVKLTVEVPEPLHNFLQAHLAYTKMSLDDWIGEAIKSGVDALIDEICIDPSFGLDKDEMVKKYKLEKFVT